MRKKRCEGITIEQDIMSSEFLQPGYERPNKKKFNRIIA